MVLTKFNQESITDAKLNGNQAEVLTIAGLNLIRQLQDRSVTFSKGQIDWWGDAYIDSDGRMNSVVAASTSCVFSTNKYVPRLPSGTKPFVVIEATSISSTGDFAINNCQIYNFATGKWVLYCTTGTDEVRRAQIYKTLFYGSNGSDGRAKTTYITGITALKTSVARDVGKKAYASYGSYNGAIGGSNRHSTNTATITASGNTSASFWSYCSTTGANDAAEAYFISSNLVNSATNTTSDETGTDRTADEVSNPASALIRVFASGGSFTNTTVRCVLLSAQAPSWANTFSGVGNIFTNVDYFTTHSVPAMTATTETPATDFPNIITHTIPAGSFGSAVSSAIMVPLIADWETGADIQYKLQSKTIKQESTTTGYSQSIRYDATNERAAQSFTTAAGETISSVKLRLYRTGTISSGDTVIRIETDSGSDTPSGTLVHANAICTVAASSINTSGTTTDTYNFAGSFALGSFTKYWIVISGTYTVSSSNYITAVGGNTTSYANGKALRYNGSAYVACSNSGPSTINTGDLTFEICTDSITADSDWLNCGDNPVISSFTAFVAEPTTLIIKLVPKSSSPTADYPAIYGVAVRPA